MPREGQNKLDIPIPALLFPIFVHTFQRLINVNHFQINGASSLAFGSLRENFSPRAELSPSLAAAFNVPRP